MSDGSHTAVSVDKPVDKKKVEFGVFPYIVWRIEDIDIKSTFSTKLSPAISFIGMKWKLKLHQIYYYHDGICGFGICLTLVRLSIPRSSLDMKLIVETEVKHDNGNCFKSDVRIQPSHKECLIWNRHYYDMCKSGSTDILRLTFLVRIYSLQINDIPPGIDDNNDASCVEDLSEDMNKLVMSDEHSDVVLKCGEKCFSAHRAILSARSDVFAAMFRNDMREAREKHVEIKNMKPAVFEQLLRYMYSGKISDLSMDSVHKIYAAADMYALEGLKVQCAFFLMEYTRNQGIVPQENKTIESENELKKRDIVTDEELLKELFLTTEWETLALEKPKLAHDICEAVLMNREP